MALSTSSTAGLHGPQPFGTRDLKPLKVPTTISAVPKGGLSRGKPPSGPSQSSNQAAHHAESASRRVLDSDREQ